MPLHSLPQSDSSGPLPFPRMPLTPLIIVCLESSIFRFIDFSLWAQLLIFLSTDCSMYLLLGLIQLFDAATWPYSIVICFWVSIPTTAGWFSPSISWSTSWNHLSFYPSPRAIYSMSQPLPSICFQSEFDSRAINPIGHLAPLVMPRDSLCSSWVRYTLLKCFLN